MPDDQPMSIPLAGAKLTHQPDGTLTLEAELPEPLAALLSRESYDGPAVTVSTPGTAHAYELSRAHGERVEARLTAELASDLLPLGHGFVPPVDEADECGAAIVCGRPAAEHRPPPEPVTLDQHNAAAAHRLGYDLPLGHRWVMPVEGDPDACRYGFLGQCGRPPLDHVDTRCGSTTPEVFARVMGLRHGKRCTLARGHDLGDHPTRHLWVESWAATNRQPMVVEWDATNAWERRAEGEPLLDPTPQDMGR